MDVRTYYKKVREAEKTVKGSDAVLVSFATPEGGKEGVRTEAPREIAAKLIAEGRARLATKVETEAYRQGLRDARDRHEQQEAARRVQVVVLPADNKKERS